MSEIPIKDLPLYSYDYDADFPLVGQAFKDTIAGVAAVLFDDARIQPLDSRRPENAIDWASRPHGKNAFARMNSIEAYIQYEKGLITSGGEVTNPSTAEFLRHFMSEFHAFIGRCYTVLARNV